MEKKTEHLTIRVTPTEKEKITKEAEKIERSAHWVLRDILKKWLGKK
jgi:hypothetical protein